MARDPIFQLCLPIAWAVIVAFVLGFGGVLAVSAPRLARDAATFSRPAVAIAPPPAGWRAAKAI